MNIYVASKSEHAPMWRSYRDAGCPIISTWIDDDNDVDPTDLWDRCIAEAASADLLVAYHRKGEEWKGAFVEIGAALANGARVFLVGNPPGSWTHHRMIVSVGSLDQFFEQFVLDVEREDDKDDEIFRTPCDYCIGKRREWTPSCELNK